jgi:hypothetical protein
MKVRRARFLFLNGVGLWGMLSHITLLSEWREAKSETLSYVCFLFVMVEAFKFSCFMCTVRR